MNILGISAYYHDSAAAILREGRISAAAQEERFTRKKHDAGFPRNAAHFCLEQAGLTFKDIDYVVFYDKPLLSLSDFWKPTSPAHPADCVPFSRRCPFGSRKSCT